jgi:hypothetical protein
VALTAWNVWSIVRVAAYVLLGSAAAAPLAAAAGYPADPVALKWLVVAGALGIALDIAAKVALSAAAGQRLAGLVDVTRLLPGSPPSVTLAPKARSGER